MFQIETQRLILRDMVETDWEPMYEITADVDALKYMDYIDFHTEQETKDWINKNIKYNSENPRSSYNLAILLKDTLEFIGWIGIGEPTDKNKGDLDFGYALNRKYWGNGYMTEALTALFDFCFKELGVKKIFGECDVRNIASQKVMEKSGMKVEEYFDDPNKETGEMEKSVRYITVSAKI